MRLIDITGQRFGRLLVLRKLPPRPSKSGGSDWQCLCDCGTECVAISSNLRQGGTTSCGCKAMEWARSMGSNKDFIAVRAVTVTRHGHKRRTGMTPEYRTWLSIKRRCQDPKCKDYPNWGGRGIQVCDAWNESFETFLRDMGPRPPGDYSIDRKNSDGNYEPDNCRWATKIQQCSENKRSNVPVTIGGVTFESIAGAARHFGVNVEKAWTRVASGIPAELAVTALGRVNRGRPKESYLRKDHRLK